MGNSNQCALPDLQANANNKDPNNIKSPLFFHSIHSANIQLSCNQRLASRIQTFCNGICFSNRAILVGERVHLRFVQVSSCWSGVLRFGFTIHDPDLMTSLPRYACPDLTNKYGYWAKALPEKYATKDTIVTFEVVQGGDVSIAVNGEEKGIFLSKVLTTNPFWALLDIYGNTNAVEFLDERMVLVKDPLTRYVNNSPLPTGFMLSAKYHHSLSPLAFHPLTGKNIILSHNNTVASRLHDEYCNGYVFTARPILPGEKLVIQILALDSAFTGGVAFGMTSCDLTTLCPGDLPDDADLLLDRKEYWVVNKDVCVANQVGDELAFTFTHAGEVKYYRNQHLVTILMHVDVEVSLSAFFDVYGNAQKIRFLGVYSELDSCQAVSSSLLALPSIDFSFDEQNRTNNSNNVVNMNIEMPANNKIDENLLTSLNTSLNISTNTPSTSGSHISQATTRSNQITTFNNNQPINISPTASFRMQAPPKLYPRKMSANPILSQSKLPSTLPVCTIHATEQEASSSRGRTRGTPCNNNSLDMLLVRQKHINQQQIQHRHHFPLDMQQKHHKPLNNPSLISTEPSQCCGHFQEFIPCMPPPSYPPPSLPPSIQLSSPPIHTSNQTTPVSANELLQPSLKTSPTDQSEECTVCMEKVPDCVLYMCGHMCMCFACATNLQSSKNPHCPICRQAIKDVIKIFKS